MRNALLYCAVLASTWNARPAPCAEETPAPGGAQILDKSIAAYSALRSYAGTSAVIHSVDFGDSKFTSTASAKIQYLRPGKLRVDGLDTRGSKYSIITDGTKTWLSWHLLKNGAYEEEAGSEMAIAKMTGVASLAPTLIPAALGETLLIWPFAPANRKSARLQGSESIAGQACYKVVADDGDSTWTFWVGQSDFLLRQATQEQDEAQSDIADAKSREMREQAPPMKLEDLPEDLRKLIEALPAEGREQMVQAMANPPAMKIKRTLSIHFFSIDSVNKALPADAFQKPPMRRAAR